MNTQIYRGKPITERFMAKVNKDGPLPEHCPELGNCWEWTGFIFPSGHGQFHLGDRDIKAQRAAWIIFVGDPSDGYVCHHCDNPKCVRIEHLYLGTHQTNMQDKAKRRTALYERSPYHKLTWGLVREIRSLVRVLRRGRRGQYERVARKFGVSVGTVSRIMRDEAWREADDPSRKVQ